MGESIGKCEICGESFVFTSARQKYCAGCREAATKAADTKQSLAYYEAHKGTINPTRNKRRREIYPSIKDAYNAKRREKHAQTKKDKE